MDHLMTTEDSYAERRQLFKNIWDTAMNIEEKDADIMNKPKVIKTLRLDEVDRYGVSKKKKLKLKNLRTVCNKILDFCDRQEADDRFYEQVMAKPVRVPYQAAVVKPAKKPKPVRGKRKIKKSKSLHSPCKSPIAKATTSERKDECSAEFASKTSGNTSPIKVKRTNRTNKATSNTSPNDLTKGKKPTKRKKHSDGYLPGVGKYYYYVDIKPIGRVKSPQKEPLQMHKVNIA